MLTEPNIEELTEIAHHLELSEDPKLEYDLLLEIVHQKSQKDLKSLFLTLGLGLGAYVKELDLNTPDLLDATKQYQLFTTLNSGSIVLKRGKKNKVWLHIWQNGQHTQKLCTPRVLQRMFGKSSQVFLAVERSALIGNKQKHPPFRRLLSFLKFETNHLWLILGYSVAMGGLGLGVPIASQSLVNNVAFGALRQPLVVLCFVLLLTLMFLALLKSLQVILVEMLQRRIFVRVTQDTTERLLRIESQAFDKSRLTELVNRFFDVVTVQKAASFLLLDGLSILLATLTGMLLLAFYHPLLFVFDVILLGVIVFILFVLGKGGQKTAIQESGTKYAIAAWLEELALHPHLFKPTNGGRFATWKTEKMLQQYLDARESHFKVVLRQNMGAFALQALAATSLLALGGWLVIEGQLTIGQLVAAELVVANVVNSFSKVGKHLETWYDMMAAFDKLGYLFDLPQESLKASLLPETSGPADLRMTGIQLKHPKGETLEIDLHLKPGKRLALLGGNTWESGKLVELIYGTRRAEKGLILIDEHPLSQLHLANYRSKIIVVSQLEMIEGSLLDNLRLGNPTLSRLEAIELLKRVGLWLRIKQLPDVLDTRISFNGFPLSTSEAYRLMLARAFAMKPRLLILDGTLDQMGWNLEGPVSHYLFQADCRLEMSILVITNKLDLLPLFDEVYTFNPQMVLEPVAVESLALSQKFKGLT